MIVWQPITSVYVAPVPVQRLPSVTLTTIGNEPFCVGVPERRPLAASVRPAGSALTVENVAEPIAPACVNVWLNAAFTVPEVVDGFVTAIVWQLMTRWYVAPLPVQPFASVAVTTMSKPPACVGVPERRPLAASVIPIGRALTVENVVVPTPPVCVNVWLKGAFAVPAVTPGFVTVIVWQEITSVYVDPVPVQPF